jgi:alcohol dehydrogenase
MGAKLAGAFPIIGVDIVASKFPLARQLGATHTIDPRAHNCVEMIRDLTGGGVNYAFDAVGSEIVMQDAYAATRRGGTTVAIGLPHPARQFSVSIASMVAEERTVMGSYMGSSVPQRDVPRYMALYRAGQLPVDQLLSKTIALNDINAAMDDLASGQVVRQVITFG